MDIDQYDEKETEQRREAAIKRMFSTPHRPLKENPKLPKSKGKKAASPKGKVARKSRVK
jgi:hypothetical protein